MCRSVGRFFEHFIKMTKNTDNLRMFTKVGPTKSPRDEWTIQYLISGINIKIVVCNDNVSVYGTENIESDSKYWSRRLRRVIKRVYEQQIKKSDTEIIHKNMLLDFVNKHHIRVTNDLLLNLANSPLEYSHCLSGGKRDVCAYLFSISSQFTGNFMFYHKDSLSTMVYFEKEEDAVLTKIAVDRMNGS